MAKPFVQHFWFEDNFLGQTERSFVRRFGEYMEPRSYAWFCPDEGVVWARAPVYRLDGSLVPFQVMTERHQGRWEITSQPGSLYLSFDHDYLNALPFSVLCREVFLHARYFPPALQEE